MAELGNLAGTRGAEWIARPPHEELQRKVRPLLPSDDPFYQPPLGFQHAEPGTVLRSRDVELAFLGLIPQPVKAVQLLYRTMDMNGEPEATATTVIVPAELAPERPCPLLSYQCAIDAVSSRCFPSYALRRRAKALGSIGQLEFLLITAAVAEGWAVSVPDHEGLHGPVGRAVRTRLSRPGRHPGRPGLGTPRALPVGADRPVGVLRRRTGQCLGGRGVRRVRARTRTSSGRCWDHPSATWATPSAGSTAVFLSGLPALVVAALAHIYPELDRVIKEHSNEEGRALLESLEKMTTVEAVIRMAGKNMGDYLDEPLESILSTPEVTHVFENIKLGAAVPTPPVLIVQAVHDYLIDVKDIDVLADAYSAGGAKVTYHRDAFNEHMLLHPLSAPMTLRWLTDRFDGRPLTEHLIRTTWPTMFHPMTYVGMARLAKIAAKVIFGRSIHRRPL